MDLQEASVQGGYKTTGKSHNVTATSVPAKRNISAFLLPPMPSSSSPLPGRKRENRYSLKGQQQRIDSRDNEARINEKRKQWDWKCGGEIVKAHQE